MQIGEYETLEKVGAGTFGTTYRARHRDSGQIVALKQLRLAGLEEWKPVERFEREAKVLRSLSHPGVVRFVDAFEHSDADGYAFYIVSEFVAGPTLGAKLSDGDRWSESEATVLLERLLETLEHLHGLSPRVIHRDIKPANIVLADDDRPVLVDFGAVADVAPAGAGGAPTVMGTPGYMAPEQAMGSVDPRSDLYALGATLVHLLTHVHPSELSRDGLELDIRDRVGCSEGFVSILERLLRPSPADRFQTAAEALAELRGGPDSQALVPTSTTALVPAAPRPMTPQVRAAVTLARTHTRALWAGFFFATIASAVGAALLDPLWSSLPLLLLTLLFPVGLLLGWMTVSRSRQRALYGDGAATEGAITSVESSRGHHTVHYDYALDGVTRQGRLHTTNMLALRDAERGSTVHVLYDPELPGRHMALLPGELGAKSGD